MKTSENYLPRKIRAFLTRSLLISFVFGLATRNEKCHKRIKMKRLLSIHTRNLIQQFDPMNKFTFLFGLLVFIRISANDGAFFASGNQLIPIFETDISVKKEVLKLKKIKNDFIEVSVYYEFFNPGKEKEITVGFEAMAPEGDVDGAPKNGHHPYMDNFLVNMNGSDLKYSVAYVADSLYAKNGKINAINLKNFSGNKSGNYIDFFYVYHFKAKFKKGLNIIKHTYRYNVSGSVDYLYDFEYILSAAARWKGGKIDDFTLILDVGEFETFSIEKGFFKNASEWEVEGDFKLENITGYPNSFIEKDAVKFHSRSGKLSFRKMNFEPKAELSVYAQKCLRCSAEEGYLPFSMYQEQFIEEPKNELERKIMKNLPYARRGLVFKNPELIKFYEKIDWYMPDPKFIAENVVLTKLEEEWVKKFK